MNKRAESTESNDLLQIETIYVVLAVVFFAIMFYFLTNTANAAITWEDYYAKEWTKVINSAKPGDIITLNIQKATEIAKKNGIVNFNEITQFDNSNNKVCIKLSKGRRSCYSYFNNVDIIEPELSLGMPVNTLTIKISEKVKQNEN